MSEEAVGLVRVHRAERIDFRALRSFAERQVDENCAVVVARIEDLDPDMTAVAAEATSAPAPKTHLPDTEDLPVAVAW